MSEKHIGKVIQVIGPVLDIQFKDGELPELLNAIEIDNHGQKLVVEVAQHTGDNVVRCIAMNSTDGLVRGTDADVFYSLVVNDESDDTRKINLEQQGEKGCGFLADNDGYVFQRPADNTYHIVITTDNSVCTMYVNDVCCYTNRIYGIQRNCWSINSYSGAIEVSGLKVAGL